MLVVAVPEFFSLPNSSIYYSMTKEKVTILQLRLLSKIPRVSIAIFEGGAWLSARLVRSCFRRHYGNLSVQLYSGSKTPIP